MVEIRYAKADILWFRCHFKTADPRANESFGFSSNFAPQDPIAHV